MLLSIFTGIGKIALIAIMIIVALGISDLMLDKIKQKKWITVILIYLLFPLVFSWTLLIIEPIIIAIRVAIAKHKESD